MAGNTGFEPILAESKSAVLTITLYAIDFDFYDNLPFKASFINCALTP